MGWGACVKDAATIKSPIIAHLGYSSQIKANADMVASIRDDVTDCYLSVRTAYVTMTSALLPTRLVLNDSTRLINGLFGPPASSTTT